MICCHLGLEQEFNFFHFFLGEKQFVISRESNELSDGKAENIVHAQFVCEDRFYSWHRNGHLQVARVENGEVLRNLSLQPGHVVAMTKAGNIIAISKGTTADLWMVSDTSATVSYVLLVNVC